MTQEISEQMLKINQKSAIINVSHRCECLIEGVTSPYCDHAMPKNYRKENNQAA